MDLAMIIAIILLFFTAFIVVGIVKEYKEKDAEVERKNNVVMKNRSTDNVALTEQEFFNFLKVNIPLTDEEFKAEYDFLLKTLNISQSLPELEKAFIDIKEHIKFRFDVIKKLNQETASNYIKRYREMFASLKKSYETRLNVVNDNVSTAKISEANTKNSWINKVGYALLLAIMYFIFKGIFYLIYN